MQRTNRNQRAPRRSGIRATGKPMPVVISSRNKRPFDVSVKMGEPTITTVVEKSIVAVTSDASGLVSLNLPVNAIANDGLRATAYLQIWNEAKIQQAQALWHSAVGTGTDGVLAMYIERTLLEVTPDDYPEASEQFESVQFRPWDDSTDNDLVGLNWLPQEPDERDFGGIAAAPGYFMISGTGLPADTTVGYVTVITRISLRGRPVPP